MFSKSMYNRYSPSRGTETAQSLPPAQHSPSAQSQPTSRNQSITQGSPAWFFVFNGGKLLVQTAGDTLGVPVKTTIDQLKMPVLARYYLGKLDNCDCYCLETGDNPAPPAGMSFRSLRSLLGLLDEELYMLAGRAYHILNWDKKTRFCGCCGSATAMKQGELAKVCHNCGDVVYPRISPAVIVAIVKGDEILLAHARYFKGNMYSLIAGFVEPGETFEDCIKREVMEEVGLKVKNPRYVGSQPWPYPDSLMVGFTAEYESGEIMVDGEEISDAGWFSCSNLPEIPTTAAIAGKIINWFCENGAKRIG